MFISHLGFTEITIFDVWVVFSDCLVQFIFFDNMIVPSNHTSHGIGVLPGGVDHDALFLLSDHIFDPLLGVFRLDPPVVEQSDISKSYAITKVTLTAAKM